MEGMGVVRKGVIGLAREKWRGGGSERAQGRKNEKRKITI